jgi:hypothetical protein
MSIEVKPVGILKNYSAGQSPVLVEPSGETIREILTRLNIPSEMVAMVVINGTLQEKDFIPLDRDVIQLIPLIGGG